MTKTSIEWCDEVWNPVTGCSKVSQGCKHCYAERIAERFWGERKFTDVRVHPERLEEPLHWRKPRRVFVNSMSDLFHEDVPFEFIAKIFAIMALAPEHTFLILTKRPVRMIEFTAYKQNWTMVQNYIDSWADNAPDVQGPLPNVWLLVSVEDQKTADERIPLLLQTPAAVRGVSYEPAIGPVDFQGWDGKYQRNYLDPGFCVDRSKRGPLDWIIMGGESGPGARPMHLDWARSVRDQCQAAGVPFFFKQMYVNGKLVKMPELDGRTWDEYPKVKP